MEINMLFIAKSIAQKCRICLINNPKIHRRPIFLPLLHSPPPSPPANHQGEVKRGSVPGEYQQVDFSQLLTCNGYKNLLASVDTFPGWPEAFQC